MKTSSFFLVALLWIVLATPQNFAQCKAQSSTQPLPFTASRYYVIVPATELTTLVKTKRLRANKTEYLDIINVVLPNSFVRQKLLDTQDITLITGLYTHDELLITQVLLPDPRSGLVTWVPIDLDSVATRQLPWQRVADDCYTRLFNYEAARHTQDMYAHRRTDFYPVIKRGNQYFTPRYQVLTEYFVLRDYPTWYPTSGDNALINCLAHPFTPLDYAEQQTAVTTSELKAQPFPFLRGELTGKLLLWKTTDNTYTFWSMPPVIIHGGVAEFGVEEFRFKPKTGLISGKYPSYFGLESTSADNVFFDVVSISTL
ncbi:hypothetical protein A0257_13905 [Hymenobacter psoromatis]|nr:hypothetical protein A0257_13905 [Hymenobacter psoromatis]